MNSALQPQGVGYPTKHVLIKIPDIVGRTISIEDLRKLITEAENSHKKFPALIEGLLLLSLNDYAQLDITVILVALNKGFAKQKSISNDVQNKVEYFIARFINWLINSNHSDKVIISLYKFICDSNDLRDNTIELASIILCYLIDNDYTYIDYLEDYSALGNSFITWLSTLDTNNLPTVETQSSMSVIAHSTDKDRLCELIRSKFAANSLGKSSINEIELMNAILYFIDKNKQAIKLINHGRLFKIFHNLMQSSAKDKHTKNAMCNICFIIYKLIERNGFANYGKEVQQQLVNALCAFIIDNKDLYSLDNKYHPKNINMSMGFSSFYALVSLIQDEIIALAVVKTRNDLLDTLSTSLICSIKMDVNSLSTTSLLTLINGMKTQLMEACPYHKLSIIFEILLQYLLDSNIAREITAVHIDVAEIMCNILYSLKNVNITQPSFNRLCSLYHNLFTHIKSQKFASNWNNIKGLVFISNTILKIIEKQTNIYSSASLQLEMLQKMCDDLDKYSHVTTATKIKLLIDIIKLIIDHPDKNIIDKKQKNKIYNILCKIFNQYITHEDKEYLAYLLHPTVMAMLIFFPQNDTASIMAINLDNKLINPLLKYFTEDIHFHLNFNIHFTRLLHKIIQDTSVNNNAIIICLAIYDNLLSLMQNHFYELKPNKQLNLIITIELLLTMIGPSEDNHDRCISLSKIISTILDNLCQNKGTIKIDYNVLCLLMLTILSLIDLFDENTKNKLVENLEALSGKDSPICYTLILLTLKFNFSSQQTAPEEVNRLLENKKILEQVRKDAQAGKVDTIYGLYLFLYNLVEKYPTYIDKDNSTTIVTLINQAIETIQTFSQPDQFLEFLLGYDILRNSITISLPEKNASNPDDATEAVAASINTEVVQPPILSNPISPMPEDQTKSTSSQSPLSNTTAVGVVRHNPKPKPQKAKIIPIQNNTKVVTETPPLQESSELSSIIADALKALGENATDSEKSRLEEILKTYYYPDGNFNPLARPSLGQPRRYGGWIICRLSIGARLIIDPNGSSLPKVFNKHEVYEMLLKQYREDGRIKNKVKKI